jgi:signal transduction histidine kinase
MSLRRKTLIHTTGTIATLLVILWFASKSLLLDSYLRLEARSVEENVERAVNALSDEMNSLNATAADWAYWDDTYQFALGNNPEFPAINIGDDTLINLNINFMLLFDSEHQILIDHVVDLEAGERLSVELAAHFVPMDRLLDHSDLTGSVTGFVETPHGPAMIASRAVLTNQSTGPAAGTLMIGRFLTGAKMQALSDSLRIHMDFHPYTQTDLHSLFPPTGPVSETAVQPADDNMVNGYRLLDDIAGQPLLLLHIAMPRVIYAQGQITQQYVLLTFLGIGFAFVLMSLIGIDHLLRRLSQLSATVTQIRKTGDTSLSIPTTGRDEIANLATGLREMLGALAYSKANLQQAHDELEQEVAARTADLRQANIELAEARDQAVAALRLKTQILANISHDARTPLSIIMLRTQMLQSGRYGPITEAQDERLASIIVNVNQLTGFIDNLLDGAQIEGAKIRLNYEAVQPSALVDNLRQTAKPLADQKGLQFVVEVADDLPDTVHIDPHRFNQILANLVGNAIKFTKAGAISVRLQRHNPEHWALEVTDTGAGIPDDALEHIFDAFWQADGSPTRDANRGVGLGLSIVKQLVGLMDGLIEVNSEVGSGTTFRVIFPIGSDCPPEAQQERSDHEHAICAGG